MRSVPVLATIALASGAALAVQVGMNNALRARVGHPMLAALVSFAVGTTVLAVYALIARPSLPDRSALVEGPSWMWLGGVVGAVYVACAAAFAARLGAAAWLALIVTGQILASLVMDHFGLVGFPRRPISPTRLIGALLLLIGVAMVLKPSAARRPEPAPAEAGEAPR